MTTPLDLVAVLLLGAEYDIYTRPRLEEELTALTPGSNVLDCRNVRYIDPTALGALVITLKRLRAADPQSTITLTNVSPIVRRIFSLTKLDKVFALR